MKHVTERGRRTRPLTRPPPPLLTLLSRSDMAAKQRLADSIGMANEEIVTEAISIIQATTSVQVSAATTGRDAPMHSFLTLLPAPALLERRRSRDRH